MAKDGKEPPKKDDAKPGAGAEGAAAKGAPKETFAERLNRIVQTPEFQRRTKWTTLFLFFAANLMTILYIVEWMKYAEWRAAIEQIKEFTHEYDPSVIGKSDFAMMAVAQNLSDELAIRTIRSDEVEAETNDVREKIKAGWALYKRNIYLFSTDKKTWPNARRFCLATKSDLATVMTTEEQEYINEQSKQVSEGYWICLRRNASWPFQVKWCRHGVKATRTYWITGQPNGKMGDCVATIFSCSTRDCWDDLPCSDKLRYLCKKGPDPRFDF